MHYEVIRSRRKTLAIEVKADGRVLVRAPLFLPQRDIERFLEQKTAWIDKTRAAAAARQTQPAFTAEEVETLRAQAKREIPPQVAAIAARMGVAYNRVTIKRQTSCWGSCSARRNLNFNCLLMLCPDAVREYVIVHELCHIKQLNHSKRFWAEVERYCTDYNAQRAWLKTEGNALIRRLRV